MRDRASAIQAFFDRQKYTLLFLLLSVGLTACVVLLTGENAVSQSLGLEAPRSIQRVSAGDILLADDFPQYLAKGWEMRFSAKTEKFHQLELGRNWRSEKGKWLCISETEITVKTGQDGSKIINESIRHPIDFQKDISVRLRLEDDGTLSCAIQTGGELYQFQFAFGFENGRGPFFARVSQGMSEVDFHVSSPDLEKGV
ncbi:MAG: hypothetical protein IJ240_10465 [Clostridia bacterium]|nr:hypothetical protein [Clostridia bacterium]